MIFSATLTAGLIFAATSVTVCSSSCDFNTLQDALTAAQPDSEIHLKKGIYKQNSQLLINKPVSIIGEEFPVIEGAGNDNVFYVTAENVRIEGLQIAHSGASYVHELSGIRVEDTKNCSIIGNRLVENAYGVYLANSVGCLIEKNTVLGAGGSETEAGNGIHSWSGKNHKITNNTVSGHRDGIYLEFTSDSEIEQNSISQNMRYGLHFMTSHRNTYLKNRFEENGAGVAVMYSRDIKMFENIFANNIGVASYGLLLKDISGGEVARNIFDDNTYGVYMEGTNRTNFHHNHFKQNGFGLRVLGNCDDNIFRENSFSANTFDVSTNSSHSPNKFERNYWSQYRGYDLDRNGTGDVPYRPVSLSSVILEKIDSTFTLIKSPLFLILDQVEQSFPMLIPETLKDENPLMMPPGALS